MNMAAGTTPEMDQLMKRAMTLLHSSHPNSATELRLLVDEQIKQRFGAEKMIANNVNKKTLETWESTFPGRETTPPPETVKEPQDYIDITDEERMKPDEVIDLVNMPDSGSEALGFTTDDSMVATSASGTAITVGDDDDAMMGNVDDDGNLKDFGDLNCCVCGEMMFTATNRLIECSKCGTLYHQECHKPPISNEEASEDQQHNWQCDACLSKPSTSKAAGVIVVPDEPLSTQMGKTKISATSSRSSSSSNPSSPFFGKAAAETTTTTTATGSVLPMAPPSPTNVLPTVAVPAANPATSSGSSSSTRHHHSKSTSTKSSYKEERSSGGSKSGSGSEKAHSSSSSSTRKSSSHSSSSKSKSSSRHHDSSSSSKRKSK